VSSEQFGFLRYEDLHGHRRSLINKTDEFVVTIAELKPDIIGVTESWADGKILDHELYIESFKLFLKDRPTVNHGGGVLLYVKDELNPVEFYPKTEYPEWCKIKGVKGDELFIGICYRSNNKEIVGTHNDSVLRELLPDVSSTWIFVLSDFNNAGLNWDNTMEDTNCATAEGRLFKDCIDDNFLIQNVTQVTQPTRGNNILDLVISSQLDLVSNVSIINALSTSDHNMYMCPTPTSV